MKKGQKKSMNKKIAALTFCALLLALCFPAQAQQPKKVPRIGYLAPGSPSAARENVEGFRKGLRELGYVEGKTIVIEYRYAEAKDDRLSDLAAELVRLKVDVIAIQSTPGVMAAKAATTTIPIVITSGTDPVATGVASSLAKPGGNITGVQ